MASSGATRRPVRPDPAWCDKATGATNKQLLPPIRTTGAAEYLDHTKEKDG